MSELVLVSNTYWWRKKAVALSVTAGDKSITLPVGWPRRPMIACWEAGVWCRKMTSALDGKPGQTHPDLRH